MPKIAGRKTNLYKGTGGTAVLVAGGREHGIKVNNEVIDITDKSSAGWRELLADVSVRSVDIDFSGLWDSTALLSASLATNPATLLSSYEVRIEGLGTLSGSFFFNSLEIGAPHDDGTEVSGTLMSSGIVTWTAA
ncbi:MAG: phage tail tube protein [Aestuariivirga sp.]